MIGPLLTRPEGEAYVHCASFWDLPMVALELHPHTEMKRSIIEESHSRNYYYNTLYYTSNHYECTESVVDLRKLS